MFFRLEFPEIRNGIHTLHTISKLVDLHSTVPCRHKECLPVKSQLKVIVRDLVIRIVRDIKIVSKSLIVIICNAFIVEIDYLRPCAGAGLGSDAHALILGFIDPEQRVSGKYRFMTVPVELFGPEYAESKNRYDKD